MNLYQKVLRPAFSMNIGKYVHDGILKVKVIPQSGRSKLKEEDGKLKLYLKSAPDKGKANAELIKYFKKEFKLSLRIKSGETSRDKVLEILS